MIYNTFNFTFCLGSGSSSSGMYALSDIAEVKEGYQTNTFNKIGDK